MASTEGELPAAPSADEERVALEAAARRVDEMKVEKALGEQSLELSRELNAADPQLILGLATLLWPGARCARVTGVMRDKLLIGAMGQSPIREELVWPLEPPLEDVDEVKPRILALRHQALAPGFDTMRAFGLLALTVALFGARYTSLHMFEGVREISRTIFGEHAQQGMEFFVHFTWSVHAAEAAYAYGVAKTNLNLPFEHALGWTLRTFLVGYGALGRLRRLHNARTLVSMETCGVTFWTPEEMASAREQRAQMKERRKAAEKKMAEQAEKRAAAEAAAAAAQSVEDDMDEDDPIE